MQHVRLITPCAAEFAHLLGGTTVFLRNLAVEFDYIPESMTDYELMKGHVAEFNAKMEEWNNQEFMKRLYKPLPTGLIWNYQINTIA